MTITMLFIYNDYNYIIFLSVPPQHTKPGLLERAGLSVAHPQPQHLPQQQTATQTTSQHTLMSMTMT